MYCEWMDAIPLPVEGCYEYNIQEYMRASNYYKNHGKTKEAEDYMKLANKERQKLDEYNSLTFFQKIVRRYKTK